MSLLLPLDVLQSKDGDQNNQVVAGLPWEYCSAPHCVYGSPGSGKSALLVSMALHLASAQSFLCWTPSEPINIIYIDYDGNSMGRITSKFIRGYGLAIDPLRFQVSDPEQVLPRITKANDEDFQAAISIMIQEVRAATGICKTIVVFDTLNALCAKVDENSSEIGQHLANLTTLSKCDPDKGTCCVVVHHTGKNSRSERGSSSIRGVCASMMSITAIKSGGKKTYKVDTDKDRIDPEGGWPDPGFRFIDSEYRDGRPYASRIDPCEDAATESTTSIRQEIRAVLDKSEMTSLDICQAIHRGKTPVVTELGSMARSGEIASHKDGKRVLWSLAARDGVDPSLLRAQKNSDNQEAAQ